MLFKETKILSRFIVLLLIAGFFSCDELPCEYPDGVNLVAGFFKYNETNIVAMPLDSFSVIILNDSIPPYEDFYKNKQNTIQFPLSILSDTSVVVLKYNDGICDTLNFYYSRSLVLINHQCGFDTFFDIDTVIHTYYKIESVWLSKSLVDYSNAENIKIYF
ncbi:MAG TPA: DUF6452 family protein [Prolixibacteraceae bacterium]|nr:DUF6452 family protein [Prolixibacteraceae bacterium]